MKFVVIYLVVAAAMYLVINMAIDGVKEAYYDKYDYLHYEAVKAVEGLPKWCDSVFGFELMQIGLAIFWLPVVVLMVIYRKEIFKF